MKNLSRTSLAAAAWLACVSGAVFSHSALAETTFKVSGYGTLAGTITNDTDYKFRSSMSQSEGADKGFDFFTDSKLGVQGVANFGNGFSITGQVLGQRKREDGTIDSNNDFSAGFEWLYAQYSPSNNFDVRAGRVVLPAFMISDSRNVGYSQPWLRAPLSVYAGMPLTNIDGGQINWRIPMGPAILTVQPTYGKSSYNIQSGRLVFDARSKWVGGLNITMEYGDWLLRAGQVRSKTEQTPFGPLGPTAPAIDFDLKDKFTSLGLQYDNGKAVVMAEWAQRKMGNMPLTGNPFWAFVTVAPGVTFADVYATQFAGKPLAETDAFYVAAGWRFGSVLPMLAYAQTKSKLTDVKNREISASVRYDFMSNLALKAQISQFYARDSQPFVSAATAGSPDYDKKINVFSIGLDFVF